MIKNKIHLEVQVGERLYQLICDNEAPLGELHDAIQQIKNFVVNKIIEANNQEKQKQVENGDQ